jgi:hypothetical protein
VRGGSASALGRRRLIPKYFSRLVVVRYVTTLVEGRRRWTCLARGLPREVVDSSLCARARAHARPARTAATLFPTLPSDVLLLEALCLPPSGVFVGSIDEARIASFVYSLALLHARRSTSVPS